MKYEEYQTKIKKVAEVKKVVFRFRILICSVLAAIAAVCITLFNTKGIITSQTKLAQLQYEYGQTIEYGASGFLVADKDIHYEFKTVEKEEEWNSTLPRHPGNYMIRPFSYNNYGNKVYGDVQNFQIVPKSSTISIVSDEIEYGSKPKISADLVSGDSIASYDVKYNDFSKESPICSVDFSSVVIKNANGENVSDCYSFSGEEKQIKILKKKITVEMHDYQKIYDGKAYSFDEKENAKISGLIEGDKIVSYPSISDTFVDCGEHSYSYSGSGLKIENSDGVDVTKHYDFQFVDGKGNVKIEKRELLLQSDSISKEYDGEKVDCGDLHVSKDTPLADTDELQWQCESENSERFEACNDVVNKFTYKVLNKTTQKDVTSNYDITVDFGKINITKKKINVNSKWIGSAKSLYFSDLKSISDPNPSIGFESGELGDGDSLHVTATFVEDKKTASCHYEYKYSILHDNGKDVTSSYDISFTDELPEIKKKKVTIKFSPIIKEYDGKGITEENINYNSFAIEDKTDSDNDVIPSYQISIPSSVTNGVQKKQIDVSLKKDGKDVTYQYDLEPVTLEYEIKKKPLSVIFDFISKDFDGDVMAGTYETSGLNPGHKIVIRDGDGSKKYELSKESGEISLSINQAGSYEFGLEQTDTQREFHKLSYNIFDENENVVNENYDVSFTDSKFDIKKKNLDISISDLVHWYDGTPFNPDEINEYLKFDGKSDFDSRFRFKFSLDKTFDGNEYFTSMSTSDVASYDLSSHLSFRIFDKDDIDVTNNFNVRFNSGNKINLYIKRVRISVQFNSSNSNTIPYGTAESLKVSNKNTDNMYLKVVENEDIQSIENYGYSFSNDQVFEMKLEGKDKGLDGYYKLSIDKLSLTPSDDIKKYGYKEIKQDKIHFLGAEDVIRLSRRKLNFSLRDVTYFYNNKDDYDFNKITAFQSDEENPYEEEPEDPYAVVKILNKEKNEGLAEGDCFVFEKKEGVTLKRDGTKNSFSDIVNWKIVDSSNKDVTSCYTPDGSTPYSSDYLLNGSLTIRVPTISLRKNDIQTKPYDGKRRSELTKVYEIDVTDSSTKGLYPTDKDGKAPELNAVILDTSGNTEYTSGRAGTYMMKLEQISFQWKEILFTYDFTKKDEQQGMNIVNIDDANLTEFYLTIGKSELSISMEDHLDNWNTIDSGTGLLAKAYYHIYDGNAITLNKTTEKGEKSIFDELKIEGLADGDEVKFYTKGQGLPLEAREDDAPYDLNEYFSVKIFKQGTQEEVTDCYDVTKVDLGELYIRKIKADITLKLKKNLYYVGDNGYLSKDDYEVELKNAFCPNDFKEEVDFTFANGIDTSSEGTRELSVLKATYQNLEWTSGNNTYMNLSVDTTGMSYQVTTRKVVIDEGSFEVSYKKDKGSYQFNVNEAEGLKSGESLEITYNGKLNPGSNFVTASELKVNVIDSNDKVVSNVNVTFKNSEIELIAKLMTLKIFVSTENNKYGDQIKFQYDKKKTKLIDFDGKQAEIEKLELKFDDSYDRKLKAGEYQLPKITWLELTSKDGKYNYDDLNVEIVTGKFSVSKRRLTIGSKYLLIEKAKLSNPTVASVKSYLTSLITVKNYKNYCFISGLLSGDEISSFDIKVTYNSSKKTYQYQFTNLKIKDSITQEDVTDCYNITYEKPTAITVGYVPVYDDDDFE